MARWKSTDGDTYIFNVSLEENGQAQKFQVGDLVRFGMKKNTSHADYALYKEITIDEETDSIEFVFSSEETQKLDVQVYQVEIELTRSGIVETVYRDRLNVLGDVVNDKA